MYPELWLYPEESVRRLRDTRTLHLERVAQLVEGGGEDQSNRIC
jgi:hypothetical protein